MAHEESDELDEERPGDEPVGDRRGDARPLRLRLHGNEEDERRGLNLAEHLRAIPPEDPDFRNLNRRRNDADSINRALQDTFYWAARTGSVTSLRTDLLAGSIPAGSTV